MIACHYFRFIMIRTHKTYFSILSVVFLTTMILIVLREGEETLYKGSHISIPSWYLNIDEASIQDSLREFNLNGVDLTDNIDRLEALLNANKTRNWIGFLNILNFQDMDFDDRCPEASGRQEYLQFLKILSSKADLPYDAGLLAILYRIKAVPHTENFNESLLETSFNINYTETTLPNQNRLFRIIIQSSNTTRGGGNFRIFANSDHVSQLCPVKDYFNGTYLSCCEIRDDLIKEDFTLSVNEEYANFEAYDHHMGNSRIIWNETVSTKTKSKSKLQNLYTSKIIHSRVSSNFADTSKSLQSSKVPNILPCKNVTSLDMTKGIWFRTNTTAHYNRYILPHQSYGYCMFSLMATEDIRSCIHKRYSYSITMMGDSHMRYSFYKFLKLVLDRDQYKISHSHQRVQKIKLYWVPKCYELVERLTRLLNTKSSPHNLIILDTGVWDLHKPAAKVSIRKISLWRIQ